VLQPFEIHDVSAIAEAVQLLNCFGDTATLYAGGTELVLVMKAGLLHYDHLINVKTVPDLHAIEYDETTHSLTIGALVTHRELEQAPVVKTHLPLLVELESQVANVRVRNVGTIGGNLSFAEPHSDPATLFLALGATLHLEGQAARTVSMDEFLVDAYETVLEEDEMLTHIELPLPTETMLGGYQRFQFHERPALNVAVFLTVDKTACGIEDARISIGCVNPKPFRASEAEGVLKGKSLEEATALLSEVGKATSEMADPSEDLNGSVEYKRHLVDVLTRRAFKQAVDQGGR